jgi:hypothetical protein
VKKWIKFGILASIPVLSIVYGLGNHLSWWDTLQGLTNLEAFHARLESSKGIPTASISNLEDGFNRLINYISDRTNNENISKRRRSGEEPIVVVRLGGTLKPYVGKGYPVELPNPNYVPNTLSIVFVYNIDIPADGLANRQLKPEDFSFRLEDMEVACSLRDLREWITESRARRHFWFSILLMNAVAILLGLIELFHKKEAGSLESSSCEMFRQRI